MENERQNDHFRKPMDVMDICLDQVAKATDFDVNNNRRVISLWMKIISHIEPFENSNPYLNLNTYAQVDCGNTTFEDQFQ